MSCGCYTRSLISRVSVFPQGSFVPPSLKCRSAFRWVPYAMRREPRNDSVAEWLGRPGYEGLGGGYDGDYYVAPGSHRTIANGLFGDAAR
jgi:hypothetical protein